MNKTITPSATATQMHHDQLKICILLCTYNGSQYIRQQIDSIINQTYTNWSIIISDDASGDDTLSIIDEYQQRLGADRLSIRNGPNQGFCANFLSMATDPSIKADLYAFCDQDDVWLSEKLDHAVNSNNWDTTRSTPYLYCGRTQIVDEALNPLGLSPDFNHAHSFKNAIVQSIAGGNTMVFNHATKQLLEAAKVISTSSHDWWLYQLVTACEGKIIYDSTPMVKYRQHGDSLIGANISYFAQFERAFQAFNNRFKQWNSVNAMALSQARHLLSKENKHTLDGFIQLRETKNPFLRLKRFFKLGIYRQTPLENIKLFIACLFNKI